MPSRFALPLARALPCEQVRALLTDYMEGALPTGLRRSIERHLALCLECDTYLRQIRQSIALTGRLADRGVPLELRTALEHAVQDWKESSSSGEEL